MKLILLKVIGSTINNSYVLLCNKENSKIKLK